MRTGRALADSETGSVAPNLRNGFQLAGLLDTHDVDSIEPLEDLEPAEIAVPRSQVRFTYPYLARFWRFVLVIAHARPRSNVSSARGTRAQCVYHPRLDVTRRRLLGLGAVGAAALLAGCGPRGEQSESSDETLDFDYMDFSGTVPADPQRVVVLEGRADLEFALVVGYPVVASGFFFGREGALFDELGDMVPDDLETFDFADSNEADFERIAILEPDLIVMRRNAYVDDFFGVARLEEIAPILGVEAGMPDWQDGMQEQARMLNRSDQAAREIDRYRDLIAEIKDRSGDRLAEMRLIWGTALPDEAGMLVITNSLGNEVATDLGIDVPLFDPLDSEEAYFEISAENLDQVTEANALAIFAFDERPALGDSAAFQRLPVAQDGRVFSVDLTLNNGLARAACAVARALEEMATA